MKYYKQNDVRYIIIIDQNDGSAWKMFGYENKHKAQEHTEELRDSHPDWDVDIFFSVCINDDK